MTSRSCRNKKTPSCAKTRMRGCAGMSQPLPPSATKMWPTPQSDVRAASSANIEDTLPASLIFNVLLNMCILAQRPMTTESRTRISMKWTRKRASERSSSQCRSAKFTKFSSRVTSTISICATSWECHSEAASDQTHKNTSLYKCLSLNNKREVVTYRLQRTSHALRAQNTTGAPPVFSWLPQNNLNKLSRFTSASPLKPAVTLSFTHLSQKSWMNLGDPCMRTAQSSNAQHDCNSCYVTVTLYRAGNFSNLILSDAPDVTFNHLSEFQDRVLGYEPDIFASILVLEHELVSHLGEAENGIHTPSSVKNK